MIHDSCVGVGFAPVDVALAKRGDIVAAKQGDFYVGGICIGRQFAGDVGLEYVTGLQEKPINWGTASTVSAASTDVPDRLSDYAD